MIVGPACSRPTKLTPDVGRAGPLALLLEDQLLHRRRATPAAFGRPVDAGVARVEERALPGQVVGPTGRPVVVRRRRARRGQRGGQPGAQLLPERLFRRGVAQVHAVRAATARAERGAANDRGQAAKSSPNSRMALPRTILRRCSSVRSAICSSAISPRARPGRVRVGVVRLVGDVVLADLVDRAQPVRVVEEAAPHVVLEVARRLLGHDVGHAAPAAVVLPDAVGPLQDVGDPADLTLRVGDLEIGEADEHAAEEEVDQREGGVGVGQRRADRRRGVRRRRRHLRRRPDVHVDDGLRLGAGAEERVPVVVGVVHAGQAQEGRDLAEAHGAHAAVRRCAAPRPPPARRPTAGSGTAG